MMWGNSSTGTSPKRFGSRLSWPFLLVLCLFLACSLYADPLTTPVQQTTPSDQYSKMTRDELLKQIADKDKLLGEWLTWQEKVKTLQAEQEQVWADQMASRDKQIADQAIVIKERTQERDEAKAELGRQQVMGWLEKAGWALGGFGLGYVTGDLTPKR